MKKELEIEDAVIIEEELQETELKSTLPSIPDKFFVEGKEYSLAEVEKIDKKAKSLAKKATEKSFEDKKLWDSIFDLKQEAVKMRTIPDKKRKEEIKPIDEFLKNLKSKTDTIGEAAKKVQTELEALLTKKENWEEEQRRLEAERIEKRTNARIAELFALETTFDPLAGTYAFGYAEGTIMNKSQIVDFDDEEWEETVADLKKEKEAHEQEVERLANERAEADRLEQERLDAEKKKVDDAAEALKTKQLKLRTKELNLNGAEFINGNWIINNVIFDPEDLVELSDEEWDAKIELAETPVEPESVIEEVPAEQATQIDIPEASAEEVPDPLAAVISEKVEAHNDHQDQVDKVIREELVFSPEKPFEEIFLKGTSWVRIFPADFEKEAVAISPDWVQNVAQLGDNNLFYLFYTKPKK